MGIFITVTNNRTVNLVALKIFTLGFNRHNKDSELFILVPQNQIDVQCLNYFKNEKCQVIEYKYKDTDDPYYVKLIISQFINNMSNDQIITYLDPDHLVFSQMFFDNIRNNEILVSSEKNHSKFLHYNTSLISGKKTDLIKVTNFWQEEYHKIVKSVNYRYREEIAFSNSAKRANVNIRRVSIKTQSSFSEFNEKSILFHYGGEYEQSKVIKNYLSNPFSDENVNSILDPQKTIPDLIRRNLLFNLTYIWRDLWH
ncbi:MAG: hypothetical protein GYA51_02380 [Candidatus Methanofastidiosa archaeon]|nr:hypothetical protein [Candidatus Methanofastidiosa archaeon]